MKMILRHINEATSDILDDIYRMQYKKSFTHFVNIEITKKNVYEYEKDKIYQMTRKTQ